MKYKVFLTLDTGGGSGITRAGASHAFYTLSQATNACYSWNELGVDYKAYMWNGSTWTQYT